MIWQGKARHGKAKQSKSNQKKEKKRKAQNYNRQIKCTGSKIKSVRFSIGKSKRGKIIYSMRQKRRGEERTERERREEIIFRYESSGILQSFKS